MQRTDSGVGGKLDFVDFDDVAEPPVRRGLRLVVTGGMRGPEKYRMLDLKRRRAQIRARRELQLT
jgi:hypothetical protein